MGRPTVFVDRDGTIVFDPGFIHRVEDIAVIPGAAAAIRQLNEAGWLVIMATNQSGIARGFITQAQYDAVAQGLLDALAAEGARLDASYYCPHYPSITGPCDCRKPGVGMYLAAQTDFQLDFADCWWIGDRFTDMIPAEKLGSPGRGVLVQTGEGLKNEAEARAAGFAVVPDLAAAVAVVIRAGAA